MLWIQLTVILPMEDSSPLSALLPYQSELPWFLSTEYTELLPDVADITACPVLQGRRLHLRLRVKMASLCAASCGVPHFQSRRNFISASYAILWNKFYFHSTKMASWRGVVRMWCNPTAGGYWSDGRLGLMILVSLRHWWLCLLAPFEYWVRSETGVPGAQKRQSSQLWGRCCRNCRFADLPCLIFWKFCVPYFILLHEE